MNANFCRWSCRSALLVAAGIVLFSNQAFSGEEMIDFESFSPEFPGWSGTISDRGTPGQYRQAVKWDTPMAFALESDKPHSGANCLKWEFVEEVPGMATLRSPDIPVAGQKGAISFFARSQGITKEGIFSFDEVSADGQKIKTNWMATKILNSDDWQKVQWSGPLDASTAAVRLAFTFVAIPAGARVWFDDISVQ